MDTEIAAPSGLSPTVRLALWGGIALLLFFPALAMLFTREVNWGPGDFVAAGGLLGLAGLGLELTARIATTPLRRALAAGTVVTMLLLVWAEQAVGIFD